MPSKQPRHERHGREAHDHVDHVGGGPGPQDLLDDVEVEERDQGPVEGAEQDEREPHGLEPLHEFHLVLLRREPTALCVTSRCTLARADGYAGTQSSRSCNARPRAATTPQQVADLLGVLVAAPTPARARPRRPARSSRRTRSSRMSTAPSASRRWASARTRSSQSAGGARSRITSRTPSSARAVGRVGEVERDLGLEPAPVAAGLRLGAAQAARRGRRARSRVRPARARRAQRAAARTRNSTGAAVDERDLERRFARVVRARARRARAEPAGGLGIDAVVPRHAAAALDAAPMTAPASPRSSARTPVGPGERDRHLAVRAALHVTAVRPAADASPPGNRSRHLAGQALRRGPAADEARRRREASGTPRCARR